MIEENSDGYEEIVLCAIKAASMSAHGLGDTVWIERLERCALVAGG